LERLAGLAVNLKQSCFGEEKQMDHWQLRISKIICTVMVIVALCSLEGCFAPEVPPGKIKLVVWGMQLGEETAGLEARIAAFEKMHPNIVVSVLGMGAGNMDPQKLMTSIVGNVPPDVIHQDRFTIGDWASRDTFLPLDNLIARDRNKPFGVRPQDYYPACWREATYTNPKTGEKHVFAIPDSTDDRALFYNKALFREAGIVDSKGNPKPPRTWDELLQDAIKLTKYNPDGTINRIGFIPNYGNSWLYLYAWQNDGEFMSPDGKRCTMNAKPNVEALAYMVKVYDALGGIDKISAFQSGFQPNELDPFLTGKVAMKIDGSWVPASIARYKPDLDFGVAPAPVPADRYYHRGRFAHDKDTFVTWAGGFSYAIPRGARHIEAAWEFIKWMTSPQAALIDAEATKEYDASKGRPFVPSLSANRVTNQVVFAKYGPKDPKFKKAMELFISMMDHARFRPVTFVGQRLWDEQVRAMDVATHHQKSPQAALDEATRVVQHELDKVFEEDTYPLIPASVPIALSVITGCIVFGLALWRVFQIRRMRQLGRVEAIAGYVFIAPWLLGFLIFTAGPMIASLYFSFCDYDVLHPARWVGLHNYAEMFGRDDGYYLRVSLFNAMYVAVIGIPLGIVTSLAVAMLLNAKVKGMSFYRTAFYLPSIVPVVASAVLWIWLLNGDPNRGLIDAAWKATLDRWFGLAPPGWLADAAWSKPALILQGLWGAGSGMILWLAGLQGIPQHLYEAAEIDGAGWWAKFRNVTVPMLSPYIFFNVIMGIIGTLQQFDSVYVLSGGDLSQPAGPLDSLLMPVLYLFKNAFQYFKMGFASALAWFLFVIILLLTLIQLKLAPKWVYYEAEKR
jgi:ABC-type sugar transport system permease subunit/ABC-type glycerol-3-phosphate transport system substrate-binding protein